jgi:putative ABC transport system permease protein
MPAAFVFQIPQVFFTIKNKENFLMSMMLTTYLASLNPLALLRSLPGACAQGLIWGLLALGVYITYKLLDFADLTVDGSMATGGAVAVMLIRAGMNPWLALVFAFLAGMAAGFITGMLHTALGIPGILASILTQIALYSINLNILGSSNQAVSVDKYSLVVSLRYISDSTATKIRMFATCVLFCVVIVAILYWYFGTEQGHAIRATGCNQQMARAQGINTDFHTVLALMISNGLVGLSGGLYAQYQGAADVNMGRGAIVIGLAAVIIGDVLFGKICAGKKIAFAYTLLSVIAGAILYYLVLSVVLWLKFPSDDLKLFSAIVVAIFLSIPYLKAKYSKKGVAK